MGEVLADFSPLRDIPAILGHPWHNFAPLRDNSASLGQPCAAPRQESPKLAGKSQCGGFSMRDRFVDAARNPPNSRTPQHTAGRRSPRTVSECRALGRIFRGFSVQKDVLPF